MRKQVFLGIDLAWAPHNATGLAALTPGPRGLSVLAAETRHGDDEIVAFVREHMGDTTVAMIDAPLVIPNESGMRPCDRETHRRFGRQQAGCYPANRGNMGRYTGGVPRGEALGARLKDLGFAWPPGPIPSPPLGAGHWVFECYPHPAHVLLFQLPTILKYKKKRQSWRAARAEFRRYLEFMRGLRQPSVAFPPDLTRALGVRGAVGRAYKSAEDRLDAIFCAYLAALVPGGRVELLGVPEEGSIAVPVVGGRGARLPVRRRAAPRRRRELTPVRAPR